jgi:FixJ family two-component response regulator
MSDAAADREPVVFVIDDSKDVREGVKALVESVGLQCEVFESPKEFLDHDIGERPCCLMLDVRLREISGLDLQLELAGSPRHIPTIIITGHGDIAMSVKAMKAGAVEFLTKPLREQDVLDAIYAAIDRDRAHLKAEEKLVELRRHFATLSSREREILPLVTSGLLNKQIAAEVGLSEVTVKVHRHNLMQKLGAKSLPDLVRMADVLNIHRGAADASHTASPRHRAAPAQ